MRIVSHLKWIWAVTLLNTKSWVALNGSLVILDKAQIFLNKPWRVLSSPIDESDMLLEELKWQTRIWYATIGVQMTNKKHNLPIYNRRLAQPDKKIFNKADYFSTLKVEQNSTCPTRKNTTNVKHWTSSANPLKCREDKNTKTT